MPTVNGGHGHKGSQNGHQGGQIVRNSTHNESDIHAMQHDDHARDNLKGAYAGEQNEAKFHREDHPTNLKARKTKKSATRTPEI